MLANGIFSSLTVNGSILDLVGDVLWRTAIDLAADAEGSAEDLQHGALELTGERLVGGAHGASDIDDLVQRDRLGVLDVLLLLAVPGRLLQGSDNQRRSRGHNRHGGLSVLDCEPDRHAETFLYFVPSLENHDRQMLLADREDRPQVEFLPQAKG